MALNRSEDEMMMTLKHEQIQQLEKNFLNFSKNPDELQIILIASECGLSVEETEVSPPTIMVYNYLLVPEIRLI